jgi:hypothetical protein
MIDDLAAAISRAIADRVAPNQLDAVTTACLAEIRRQGYAVVPRVLTPTMTAAVMDPGRANGSPLSKGFADAFAAAIEAGDVLR